MLSDAQLGAVVGGMVYAAVREPVSMTCFTLCACPDTNKVTMICTQ
jgi:hypothetical protein